MFLKTKGRRGFSAVSPSRNERGGIAGGNRRRGRWKLIRLRVKTRRAIPIGSGMMSTRSQVKRTIPGPRISSPFIIIDGCRKLISTAAIRTSAFRREERNRGRKALAEKLTVAMVMITRPATRTRAASDHLRMVALEEIRLECFRDLRGIRVGGDTSSGGDGFSCLSDMGSQALCAGSAKFEWVQEFNCFPVYLWYVNFHIPARQPEAAAWSRFFVLDVRDTLPMTQTMFARVRGLVLLVFLPPLTMVFSLATLVAILVFRLPQKKCAAIPRVWGRLVTMLSGVRVEVSGKENIAPDRPYIFAGNHQSQFDIFALQGHFPFDFRWLAKKELFGIPFFGPAMLKAGHIPVDRAHGRRAVKSLDAAADRISSGTSVIIFPEGTRSPDGKLKEFKVGAMVLAIKAGVPLVPIAICGTHEILPKGAYLARPGRVAIRIGKPIDTTGMSLKDKGELAARLRREVAALLAADS